LHQNAKKEMSTAAKNAALFFQKRTFQLAAGKTTGMGFIGIVPTAT
jgi:hypothetical protein